MARLRESELSKFLYELLNVFLRLWHEVYLALVDPDLWYVEAHGAL